MLHLLLAHHLRKYREKQVVFFFRKVQLSPSRWTQSRPKFVYKFRAFHFPKKTEFSFRKSIVVIVLSFSFSRLSLVFPDYLILFYLTYHILLQPHHSLVKQLFLVTSFYSIQLITFFFKHTECVSFPVLHFFSF